MICCLEAKNYSIPFSKFYALEAEKAELPEINKIQRLERLAGRIMSNENVTRVVIITLAVVLFTIRVSAKGTGIDALGNTLTNLIRQWAFWILSIGCTVEIIKSAMGGESKKTLSIVMKYVIIFASMYIVPTIFIAIRDAF